MLEVKNITKIYGKKVVVSDLSFTLEKGEVLGFLGPNGAGKSTTMNIITGYIGATSGKVSIGGYDTLEDVNKVKGKIGYLPETPPVYADMTVEEYLKFVCELKKVKKVEFKDVLDNVMELVKIEHVRGRVIKNLSKGYKQRVGIAQAVIGNPEIIIFDEPTVGLDPKEIVEIRKLIKDIGQNKTVILSSHILSEIEEVCDRILIINNGKFVAIGTKEELQKKLGNSNILSLSVKGEKDDVTSVLNSVVGVEEVIYLGSNKEFVHDFRVNLTDGYDPREIIFYKLSDKKLPILSMKKDDLDLEKIFLQITN